MGAKGAERRKETRREGRGTEENLWDVGSSSLGWVGRGERVFSAQTFIGTVRMSVMDAGGGSHATCYPGHKVGVRKGQGEAEDAVDYCFAGRSLSGAGYLGLFRIAVCRGCRATSSAESGGCVILLIFPMPLCSC